MIYEVAQTSSPISQGDIFNGIPRIDLPTDYLSIFGEDEQPRPLTWEEFSSQRAPVSAIVGMRPVVAMVGSQDCEGIRARDITLFEIRPFKEVEGLSRNTSSPKSWASIITQHSKVNQKWFYLPPDSLAGFEDKMAVDFQVPLRIPRVALDELVKFRNVRLNEMAREHFRERLAEFFRRYSYDEWYALNEPELDQYQKDHPDAKPYPWQKRL